MYYKAVTTTKGEDGMDTLTHDDIRTAVRARYGMIAETRGAAAPTTEASCCGGSILRRRQPLVLRRDCHGDP